jgi:hypothetical protein
MTVLPDVSLEEYSTFTKLSCQSIRCHFTCKLELNLRKMLQVRNIFLCGAEIWTLREYFGSYEMRFEGMEKIIWGNRVKNEVFKQSRMRRISFIQ